MVIGIEINMPVWPLVAIPLLIAAQYYVMNMDTSQTRSKFLFYIDVAIPVVGIILCGLLYHYTSFTAK